MRAFGYLLIGIGVIYLFFAFNMDVSISTTGTYVPGYGSIGGGNVANLDLMARRQNHLIIAALITLVGVLMAIFGPNECQAAALGQSVSAAPSQLEFDGERDISSDAYRLWLSKAHKIERNDVFDRFVIGEKTFNNLDEALAHAHDIELQIIEDERKKQERRDAQVAADNETARFNAEKADAEWQESKPKIIVGIIIFVGLVVAAYFLLRETPEERSARIALEKAERVELVSGVEKQFGITLPEDASNIKVTVNAANYAFSCDDEVTGTLLKFETASTEKAVKDLFAKSLGDGSAKYELLEDFDWTWRINKTRYELSSFSEAPPTDVSLCMVK